MSLGFDSRAPKELAAPGSKPEMNSDDSSDVGDAAVKAEAAAVVSAGDATPKEALALLRRMLLEAWKAKPD